MDLKTKVKRSAICAGVSVLQSARFGSFSSFCSAVCTAASIGTLVTTFSFCQTVFQAFRKSIHVFFPSCSSFSFCCLSSCKSSTKKVQLPSDATSFFLRVNNHLFNFHLSLNLFSVHRVIHPAASLKTPQNTKNWMLIVEKKSFCCFRSH